ncbi:hypothetical protein SLH49_08740 [Cognatiyoonia sp. IB215446]|uniref:hypothetical protein n=1 Tax=Cognatiyoonia sp. IB215446 TaxID=3097355 RepID=UPI002A1764DF|nr:hypothetical protein [Cognatiyoonia sp. IB215446]MDX8348072.1 hypothetical protein [Cognatiyoonia sp. IB215446]
MSFVLSAGFLSSIWLAVHLFVGGRQIATPLLASDLAPLVRQTQYLCWHFTSVAIAAMAVLNLWAVITDDPAFALAAFLLAVGFATVGIGLVLRLGARHLDLPQGWLFVPVALLGGLGLWL